MQLPVTTCRRCLVSATTKPRGASSNPNRFYGQIVRQANDVVKQSVHSCRATLTKLRRVVGACQSALHGPSGLLNGRHVRYGVNVTLTGQTQTLNAFAYAVGEPRRGHRRVSVASSGVTTTRGSVSCFEDRAVTPSRRPKAHVHVCLDRQFSATGNRRTLYARTLPASSQHPAAD